MTPLERLRWYLSGEVAYWAHEYDDPSDAVFRPLAFALISFYSFYAAVTLGNSGVSASATLFLSFFGTLMFYGTILLTAGTVIYYRERTGVRAPENW